jgi:non-ribosomal peptide synthetase component F
MRTRPALEPEQLRRALERLAAHHPMLRARFAECDGRPVQWICAHPYVPMRVVEVADLDGEEMAAFERTERTRAIDLANQPPIRAILYLAGDQSVLCLVLDHLACDGWSFFQLLDELGAILDAQSSGAEWLAIPERSTFTDYVAYERDWLQSKSAAKQLDYWRGAFARARPSVELHHDAVSEAPAIRRPSLVRMLPEKLSRALIDLTRKHRVSMFDALSAAYAWMLHRTSGEHELSIGTVMPTRGERWKRSIGNFVNPVVMPVKLAPDMTLQALLLTLQEVSFRTLRNKDYPFDELATALEPFGLRPNGAHLKTCLVFHKARKAQQLYPVFACFKSAPAVPWGGVEVEAFGDHVTSGFADQDLKLEAVEFGDRVCVSWTYDALRFASSTIETIAESFETLLSAMIADRGEPISQLAWVPDDQLQRLAAWNASCSGTCHARFVHEQFEAHAAQTPDAVAVQFESETLSYAELNARANQLAAHLRTLGIRPEMRVAICIERSFELIEAVIATLKAGGAFVPLDPTYPLARLEYMLHDSAPTVVLTCGAARGSLAALTASPIVDLQRDRAVWGGATRTNPDSAELGLLPRNLAYVIYTSGSTGTPKGAMNEHRGLSNLVAAQADVFGVDSSSRMLQFASPSFDASVSEIALALTRGASLYLAHRADLMPGRPLLNLLAHHRITHVTLPPAALPLCEDFEVPFAAQTLIVAGEAIRVSEAD